MIFQTEKLTKSFGGLMAVNGVNLALEKGEIRAVIGPNGAGKTTLFNLITGYLSSDSGRVIFKGKDITRLSPCLISRRGIARSFQIINIYPKLSVFENVQVAVLSHHRKTANIFSLARRMVREETEAILEKVGLLEQEKAMADSLAHGDKKRLELGITLGNEPELLLLDEPTAGMSPEETVSTMTLVKSLNDEQGLTILFTEHDMSVVFGYAQNITVLHQGAVLCEGKPDDVRCNEEVQRIYLGGAV